MAPETRALIERAEIVQLSARELCRETADALRKLERLRAERERAIRGFDAAKRQRPDR